MKNELFFEDEAQEKLFAGISKVYKAISVTLGSRGKNAVYKKWAMPMITNDGVSIARAIRLADEAEKMGADLIKEAAERTNDEAGDGTTTATILTYHLIDEGKKILKTSPDITPMQLRKELDEALEEASKELSDRAIKVVSDDDLLKIAQISSENANVAKIVAEAVKEAGENGRVVVEDSQGLTIEKLNINGMEIEGGFISPYSINVPDKGVAILENPYVLVSDRVFNLGNEIFPLIKEAKDQGVTNIIVVCQDAQNEALLTMLMNREKGINVIPVKAPRDKDFLEDLANFCGKASAIGTGKYVKTVSFGDLIQVKKVIAYKDKTLFMKTDRNDLEEAHYTQKVDSLKELITYASNDDKPKLQDRLARITGSVVVIKTGAQTHTEMGYIRLKVEDAVNAVKAAVDEGYVAGGGITLKDVGEKVNAKLGTKGSEVLAKACSKPIEILLKNAGVVYDPSKITDKNGFDTDSGQYVEDMIGRGIIDPVKVSKKALHNAISLAGMFLTISTLIVELPGERPTI